MERPSHYHFFTIKGQMLTGIGTNAVDAFDSALKSFKLLHSGQFIYPIDHEKTVCKGKVSDDYFAWLKKRQTESDRIDAIISLCDNSSEIIRVCRAIGVDCNSVLARFATTPREKKIGASA